MTMELNLTIPFKTEKDAEAAVSALQSEVDFKGRAKARVAREKNKIIINLTADDISALHATTSSFMRALKVILTI